MKKILPVLLVLALSACAPHPTWGCGFPDIGLCQDYIAGINRESSAVSTCAATGGQFRDTPCPRGTATLGWCVVSSPSGLTLRQTFYVTPSIATVADAQNVCSMLVTLEPGSNVSFQPYTGS